MNTAKRKFRCENKYIINVAEIELLRNRISGICELDEYAQMSREYNIRSLYFDNYKSTSFYDNEMGIDPREKFRIRIYNCNADVILLERKIKVNGKISKDRTKISREILDAILNDSVDEIIIDSNNALLNSFLLKYHMEYLRPKIIVDYVREAYVSVAEDIRITFDKAISFSDNVEGFLNEGVFLQPIMPLGKELLEVKYTEFMPDYIYRSLDLGDLHQSTFSKYYLCEKIRREGEL